MTELISGVNNWLEWLKGLVWNWPLVALLLGAGVVFTVVLGFVQFRGFFHAWTLPFSKKHRHPGEQSHFKALTMALSVPQWPL